MPGRSPQVRVSVAMCTRDGAPFVREQLESILRQTAPPDEIIVSDDTSTDGTTEIVEDVLEKYRSDQRHSPLATQIISNPLPLGVIRNFEQAVARASGGLIALSDQDDRWSMNRLERLRGIFHARPRLLLIHGDAELVDAAGDPIGSTLFEAIGITHAERGDVHSGRAFEAYLKRNLATGATMMFRRELLEWALPFPENWIHDEWLASIAAAVGEVDVIDERLIDYRQHSRNAIGAQRLSPIGMVRRLLEPRAARNARLVLRAQELVDRLAELGSVVPPSVFEGAKGKLAHESCRARLPARRISRVRPILAELRRGGYAAYGRGGPDVLRDLVQPPGG